MKCKQFERELPDWISGRLGSTAQSEMQLHSGDCRACAATEAKERMMVARMQSIAAPANVPNLWGRIEDRIAQPSRRAKFAFNRMFVYGGALALAACALFMFSVNRPTVVLPIRPVVQAGTSADAGRYQISDTDDSIAETPLSSDRARMLLVGYSPR